MNALVHENKAIVTDIAGTTRDVIEEYVNVRGVPLRLVDTAGIRETEDIVEKIGVEKSRKVLKEADLILLVINGNETLSQEDENLFRAAAGLDKIVIINKTDLEMKADMNRIKELAEHSPLISTSLVKEEGIDELEQAIANLFFAGGIEAQDLTYVSNSRHIALLQQTIHHIDEALGGIEADLPIDMVQIDITRAWEILGEIVGDTVSESLIDQLFSQFCLGK